MDTLLQTSREAIELTPILEGTMMAQGSPFAEGVQNVQAGYNAILQATGITDEERTQQLFAYDRINKLYGLIENTRIERANNLSNGRGVTDAARAQIHGRGVTDAARAQIQRISPSHDKQWSANRLLIADFLEEELATLKARGVPMLPGQVQKIEETIGRLRTEETGSSPMIDLEAIATATIDEIAELIDKTDPSDTKTWAAIKRRFDELTSAD
jgi:hypothetical protein